MCTRPPEETRILEGVVTTLPTPDARSEQANIAPMGPIVNPSITQLILRPFQTSTTYRNLKATGQGVFHVTDDALLIARAAIGHIQPVHEVAIQPAPHVHGIVLSGACRYYEFRVVELDDREPRTRIVAKVIHTGRLREFFGFNRAKHAVIEAAILATRVHLTGLQPVRDELCKLQTLVDKTGGEAEQLAMNELRTYVNTYQPKPQHPNPEP